MPGGMPGGVPGGMPGGVPEGVPRGVPWGVPDGVPDGVPGASIKTANKKMCHFSGRAELYLFFRLVNFFVCQSQTRISDCC